MRLQIVLPVVAAAVLATTEAVSTIDFNGLQMVSPNAPLHTHADEGKRLLRSEIVDEDDDDVFEDDEDESEDDENERMFLLNLFKKNKGKTPLGLVEESAQASTLNNIEVGKKYQYLIDEMETTRRFGNTGHVPNLDMEKMFHQILRKEFTEMEIKKFKGLIAEGETPHTYDERHFYTSRKVPYSQLMLEDKFSTRFRNYYKIAMMFDMVDNKHVDMLKFIKNNDLIVGDMGYTKQEIDLFEKWIADGWTYELKNRIPTDDVETKNKFLSFYLELMEKTASL